MNDWPTWQNQLGENLHLSIRAKWSETDLEWECFKGQRVICNEDISRRGTKASLQILLVDGILCLEDFCIMIVAVLEQYQSGCI